MIFFVLKIVLALCSLFLAGWVLKVAFSAFSIAKNIDAMTEEDYLLLCVQVGRLEGFTLPPTRKEFKKAFIASRLSQVAILTLFQVPTLWGLVSL